VPVTARYDIKCKMIDQAVSMDKNAGFTHWRSRIVNKVGYMSGTIHTHAAVLYCCGSPKPASSTE